jgi:hypothetical protein
MAGVLLYPLYTSNRQVDARSTAPTYCHFVRVRDSANSWPEVISDMCLYNEFRLAVTVPWDLVSKSKKVAI